MTQVSINEAEGRLASLIQAAKEGEDVVITDGDEPVAWLVYVEGATRVRQPRRAGSGKGKFIMSPDFNAPLEDFKELPAR
jgi:antitoxin (DNA-binding transcriptional repressor) of toxin-antitoxin stability system